MHQGLLDDHGPAFGGKTRRLSIERRRCCQEQDIKATNRPPNQKALLLPTNNDLFLSCCPGGFYYACFTKRLETYNESEDCTAIVFAISLTWLTLCHGHATYRSRLLYSMQCLGPSWHGLVRWQRLYTYASGTCQIDVGLGSYLRTFPTIDCVVCRPISSFLLGEYG